MYPTSLMLLTGLKLSGTVSLFLLLACSPSMSVAGMSWARRLTAVLLGVAVRMLKLECSFQT